MQTIFDPELAAAMGTPLAPGEGLQHPPTMAEARAHFEQVAIAPFKAFQEPLLPSGECIGVRYYVKMTYWLLQRLHTSCVTRRC